MKVMVIGQGGREHALVKALARSPSVSEIHAVPGNDGMTREALCHPLQWTETEDLIQLCLRTEIDFVFIGPEDPLVDGLADRLRERGILVVGPGREAAQLEGSKIYAKQFMHEANIPTAPFAVVDSVHQVIEEMKNFTPPYVLKADGLAGGKGVFICNTKEELVEKAKDLFDHQILGDAGQRALLEQFQQGWELSYLVLTNGQQWQTLPLAQDHKRLKDGDEGPNTGGMGTVAPLSISTDLRHQIETDIVARSIQKISQDGLIYRGVLFIGIMVTPDGPQVLEYNTRFGDPETQVILPLIEGDLGQIFWNLSRGELQRITTRQMSTACVILAAEGYPDHPVKGAPIEGNINFNSNSSYFIHAGTKRTGEDQWTVQGGRVLGAIGCGSNLEEALGEAYQLAEKVKWKGQQMRRDIGQKVKS